MNYKFILKVGGILGVGLAIYKACRERPIRKQEEIKEVDRSNEYPYYGVPVTTNDSTGALKLPNGQFARTTDIMYGDRGEIIVK